MNKIKSKLVQLSNIYRYYGLKYALFELLSSILGQKNRVGQKVFYIKHELVKDYLKTEYSDILQKYQKMNYKQENISQKKVWVFWWQGYEEMPEIVKTCYHSIQRQLHELDVILVSKDNIHNFLNIPAPISEKIEKGTFSLTIFSDYIRLSLLAKYGGLWLDSTIFLTKNIKDSLYKTSFFSINYNTDQLDYHVCKGKWMVSVLGAEKDNTALMFCQELFETYFLREETHLAYLILDCIIAIAYEHFPDFQDSVDQLSVEHSGVGLLDDYLSDRMMYSDFKTLYQTQAIHKLSHKVDYGHRINILSELMLNNGEYDAKNS